jgi:hypothetical protein
MGNISWSGAAEVCWSSTMPRASAGSGRLPTAKLPCAYPTDTDTPRKWWPTCMRRCDRHLGSAGGPVRARRAVRAVGGDWLRHRTGHALPRPPPQRHGLPPQHLQCPDPPAGALRLDRPGHLCDPASRHRRFPNAPGDRLFRRAGRSRRSLPRSTYLSAAQRALRRCCGQAPPGTRRPGQRTHVVVANQGTAAGWLAPRTGRRASA